MTNEIVTPDAIEPEQARQLDELLGEHGAEIARQVDLLVRRVDALVAGVEASTELYR